MLLQKRSNGVYYFRWVYPPALRKVLGKRELLKSLRTTSKSQALSRAGAYYVVVDRLKDIYSSLESDKSAWSDAFHSLDKHFDGTNIEEDKVKRLLEECYSSDVPRYSKALFELAEVYKPASLADVLRKKAEISSLLEMHQEASTNINGELRNEGSIKHELASLFAKAIDVDSFDSVDYEGFEFSSASRESAQQLVESYIFFKLGNFYYLFWYYPELAAKYLREIEQVLFAYYCKMESQLTASMRVPELPSFMAPTEVEPLPITAQPASIKFSDLFAQFLNYKQKEEGLTDRISKEYKGYFPIISQFIGDASIAKIKVKTIKDCLQRYAKLPVRNKAPYKGMSIQAIEAMYIPDTDLVTPKTVTQVRKMLQSIFNYALQNELIDKSPMVGLKLNLRTTEGRGRFNNEQVRLILSEASNQQDDWKRWVVRLASYTGARLGELVQLRKEDVKFDSDSQIHYLLITPDAGNLKTENAFRWVPIHSQLIAMGFLGFAGGGVGRLFHDGLTSHKATKWFTPFRKSIGIPDTNEFNEKLSFHSLRHSFVTEARTAGIQDAALQQVVGHTITSAGITDNYTGRFEIRVLQPVVEAVKY
jgi:integrase